MATVILATPPLWRAFQRLPRPNWVGYFLAFAFVPLLLEWVFVFRGLGGLLKQGIGAEPGVLGMPQLVLYWTLIMSVLLMTSYRWLTRLFTVNTSQPIGL